MTRSIESFFHMTTKKWLNMVLLGGAVALAPTLGLAGDKDKHGKSGDKRIASTTMNAQRHQGGQDNQRDSSQKPLGKPSNKSQVPTEMLPLQLQGNSNGGTKGSTSGDLNALNQKPESAGKKKSNSTDLNGLSPQSEPPSRFSDKSGKKILKPGDLKGPNPQADLSNHLSDSKRKGNPKPTELKGLNQKLDSHAKTMDLSGKKTIKPGDLTLPKDDSKHVAAKKAGNFLDLHKAGKFDGVVKGAVAKKIDLGKQFELKHKGDLALKLNLAHKIKSHGGWTKSHWAGLIGPGFGVGYSPFAYCGPWYFPSHCLYPSWSPWVEFSWGYGFDPICDPRPWFCRPWIYDPCPVWTYWTYPVWYELPVAVCGTWIDVEPVLIDEGLDLQLLAVRFVDPGHLELCEGPRFRVWARNNSARTIVKGFNVLLLAANTREAVTELPQAGVRVDSIEPGEIKAFDIRLPFEASTLGRDASGNATPFSQLHVLVDSHREIPEAFEENNGAVIARGDILPVDPAIFGADSMTPLAGTELNIAGEGFGPEPGQVLVHVGGIELQAEIEGWYDLGVRVKLPSLALASPTDAQLIVIRGDTAASNPLPIQLTMPVASR